MKSNKQNNLYVIRKYVVASSITDALKKEKAKSVDEVVIDSMNIKINENIGFK